MAEETGTAGGSAEFPIFKSGEGAFDRAKYDEQNKARFISDGITVTATGKEIDDDLKKKKVSAEDVTKKANKFYDDSFDRNLKEIDPVIIKTGVYYDNAYSGIQIDRNKIKRRIDKGEAIDGKEIFEMAKDAAKNKITNTNKLKTGNVTQIVEKLGFKTIKDFDLYDDVKSDFDSKIKDDKLKFDPMLDKLRPLLSYFNDNGPMAGQNSSKLFTPENNAILSALARILKEEGFESESVTNMSKKYKENLEILAEKIGPLESKKMDKEGDVVAATGPTGTISETKLEEKKGATGSTGTPTGTTGSTGTPTGTTGSTGTPTGPTGSTGTTIESATDTKEVTGGVTGAAVSSAETKLAETKSGTGPTGSTGSTNKSDPAKVDSENSDAKVNSMIKDLLGIDLSAAGGTGVTGKGNSETEKLAEKKAEDLFGSSKKASESTGETGNSEIKEPGKKNEETKLETKVDEKIEKGNETLPVSTGKIETTTQNLSSVNLPVENQKEPDPPTNTNTSVTNFDKVDTESGSTESPKNESSKDEKKTNGNKTEGEGNKEMLETMKNMVTLLTQLNSTMQSPLIVTPTNKKF